MALGSTVADRKPQSQRRRGLQEELDCRMWPHQTFLKVHITGQRWQRIQVPQKQRTCQGACHRNAAAPTVHSRQVLPPQSLSSGGGETTRCIVYAREPGEKHGSACCGAMPDRVGFLKPLGLQDSVPDSASD